MPDAGLTHIALVVTNAESSIRFYEKYARMRVVHRRPQSRNNGKTVAWMSDGVRPFVIVLLEEDHVAHPLRPFSHLGYACRTMDDFSQMCALARAEGVLIDGPTDSGPPVGIWAFLSDPDGHTLELSFGQEVERTVGERDMV